MAMGGGVRQEDNAAVREAPGTLGWMMGRLGTEGVAGY